MATPSKVLFVHTDSKTPIAELYFHYDGYPDHMLPFLNGFLEAVQKDTPNDTRFADPSYLAARLITYFALLRHHERPEQPILGFTGIGVINSEVSSDAMYSYAIICSPDGMPAIKWMKRSYSPAGSNTRAVLADPAWLEPSQASPQRA